jgi:hypothetical protein
MWHHRRNVSLENPVFDPVPGVTRLEEKRADTSAENEALSWLAQQLKFERTLEVLRTQGPAPAREERVAA